MINFKKLLSCFYLKKTVIKRLKDPLFYTLSLWKEFTATIFKLCINERQSFSPKQRARVNCCFSSLCLCQQYCERQQTVRRDSTKKRINDNSGGLDYVNVK